MNHTTNEAVALLEQMPVDQQAVAIGVLTDMTKRRPVLSDTTVRALFLEYSADAGFDYAENTYTFNVLKDVFEGLVAENTRTDHSGYPVGTERAAHHIGLAKNTLARMRRANSQED